jgi:hypothetical protein
VADADRTVKRISALKGQGIVDGIGAVIVVHAGVGLNRALVKYTTTIVPHARISATWIIFTSGQTIAFFFNFTAS